MESSPEHLATICVGYREIFWMRRNARENNFTRYCLAIFPGTCFWCTDVYRCQLRSVCLSEKPHAVKVNLSVLFLLFFQATMNA